MPGRRCPACDSSTTIELVRARVRDTYLRLSSSAPMDESLIVSESHGCLPSYTHKMICSAIDYSLRSQY